MARNVKPRSEVPGSLALQMNQRAMDEEKVRELHVPSTRYTDSVPQARKQREAEETEKAAKVAQEKEEMFKDEAMRQLLAREQQYRARKRANSEATETPMSGDTMTESFPHAVEINGVSFDTVKLFHPRQGLSFCHCA